MLEKQTAAKIVIALSRLPGVRLYRNTIGFGWVSNSSRRLSDGSVVLINPRRVTFGLFKGSSDYIGWKSVLITPDMVGRKVAVFLAVETKRSSSAKKTEEQQHFITVVRAAGGLAGFADSEETALKIVTGDL